ncbi:MAG: divalent-cation tolerance protein CutA [Dehalococcoidales bacterium]|nr:divalent-cation tolerance protein CutA [Dehalococcoidales bacterium]
MKQKSYIVVFITASSPSEAKKISTTLLKRRQAACVNIIPGVNSHFWWQDKLDTAEESLLIVKTRENLLPDLIKSVKKLHSNDVPEIIALPIVGGNPDYLNWLDSETA